MKKILVKKILLIGGGGHCLSCIAAIESAANYTIQGVVDGGPHEATAGGEEGKLLAGHPVLGGDDRLPELLQGCDIALVSVGFVDSCEARMRLFETLQNLEKEQGVEKTEAVVAGNASIAREARLGAGTIAMQFALVNAGAVVGENCILNNRALIEHGVRIGDHSHISTGAIVNGDCEIGSRVFVGSGAVIKHGVRIGDEVRIGAGAVVVRDLTQPGWHAGNPAQIL